MKGDSSVRKLHGGEYDRLWGLAKYWIPGYSKDESIVGTSKDPTFAFKPIS